MTRAARGFGSREPVARARCVVAEAEIALAARDLSWPAEALDAARETLEERGDLVNAAHARYLAVRRLLLIGRLGEAERMLATLDPAPFPPALRAAHELVAAGIAMRRIRSKDAAQALARAEQAARHSGVPALIAEVDHLAAVLDAPAARRMTNGGEQVLTLAAVEDLLASGSLVIDGCRHVVNRGNTIVPLAGRPVLFALARTLSEAWPGDASRSELLASFGAHFTDASHRARLRVEIARLRAALAPLAGVEATKAVFVLVPRDERDVVVISRPAEERHGGVLALLSDGEGWSSSALALALGTSQRSVQRALDALAAAGKIEASGRGRARRWIASPAPGFATVLLLPAPLPIE